jgi:hypothetical protein
MDSEVEVSELLSSAIRAMCFSYRVPTGVHNRAEAQGLFHPSDV